MPINPIQARIAPQNLETDRVGSIHSARARQHAKDAIASVEGRHAEHRPRTDVRPAENLLQQKIGPLPHLFRDSRQLGAGVSGGIGASLHYWVDDGIADKDAALCLICGYDSELCAQACFSKVS